MCHAVNRPDKRLRPDVGDDLRESLREPPLSDCPQQHSSCPGRRIGRAAQAGKGGKCRESSVLCVVDRLQGKRPRLTANPRQLCGGASADSSLVALRDQRGLFGSEGAQTRVPAGEHKNPFLGG
jgi:hypothetical protein